MPGRIANRLAHYSRTLMPRRAPPFDANHRVNAIVVDPPADPLDLFRPETPAEILANKPNWCMIGLAANEALAKARKALLGLYQGGKDTNAHSRIRRTSEPFRSSQEGKSHRNRSACKAP
jgi:hypothetical protein